MIPPPFLKMTIANIPIYTHTKKKQVGAYITQFQVNDLCAVNLLSVIPVSFISALKLFNKRLHS